MEQLQSTIETHLAWHRRRSDEMERRLVRYLGERAPDGAAGQQVA